MKAEIKVLANPETEAIRSRGPAVETIEHQTGFSKDANHGDRWL
jgi:hypothetical protein